MPNLFGFLIGDDIQVDISHRRIIRFTSDNGFYLCAVVMKEVVMDLFVYLLRNATNDEVSKEELLSKVWEDKNLSSSTQRLWQVLKELKSKLSIIGFPSDFIVTSRGHGYRINYKLITPIYF